MYVCAQYIKMFVCSNSLKDHFVEDLLWETEHIIFKQVVIGA